MPNKNYIKGVRKERAIVNAARKRGLIAFRSAGSHSPIDCIIINTKLKSVRFIQAKPDSMPEAQKKRLEEEHKELNDFFKCCFQVI